MIKSNVHSQIKTYSCLRKQKINQFQMLLKQMIGYQIILIFLWSCKKITSNFKIFSRSSKNRIVTIFCDFLILYCNMIRLCLWNINVEKSCWHLHKSLKPCFLYLSSIFWCFSKALIPDLLAIIIGYLCSLTIIEKKCRMINNRSPQKKREQVLFFLLHNKFKIVFRIANQRICSNGWF